MLTKNSKIIIAALVLFKMPAVTDKQLKKTGGFSLEEIKKIHELKAMLQRYPNLYVAYKNSNTLSEMLDALKFPTTEIEILKLLDGLSAGRITTLNISELFVDLAFHHRIIYWYIVGLKRIKCFLDKGRSVFFIYAATNNIKGIEESLVMIQGLIKLELIPNQNYLNSTDDEGNTPLMVACSYDNTDAIRSLLKNSASPTSRNLKGEIALHHCAFRGSTDGVVALLDNRAAINAETKDGQTPFIIAVKNNQLACAQLLLKRGAAINALGPKKQSALAICISEYINLRDKGSDVSEVLKKIEFLRDNKANFNIYVNGDDPKLVQSYFYSFFLLLETEFAKSDYQLVQIFAKSNFDFNSKKTLSKNDDKSHKMVILQTGNIELIKACGLIQENTSIATAMINGQKVVLYSDTLKNLPIELQQQLKQYWRELDLELKVDDLEVNKASSAAVPSISEAVLQQKCNDIQKTLTKIKDLIESLKFNLPTWIEKITPEKLVGLEWDSLEALATKLQTWEEKTNLKIAALTETDNSVAKANHTVSSSAFFQPLPKSAPIKCMYENQLPFDSRLMIKVRGTENTYLLLPFNDKGEVGLKVITEYSSIAPEICEIFENLIGGIDIPLSNAKGKPGVKFIGKTYTSWVTINVKSEERTVVAELKHPKLLDRFALYRLSLQGTGPMVLALGPFIFKGLHDNSHNKLLGIAPPQNFAPDNIERVCLAFEQKQKIAKVVVPENRFST